jgi:hypothetical protein
MHFQLGARHHLMRLHGVSIQTLSVHGAVVCVMPSRTMRKGASVRGLLEFTTATTSPAVISVALEYTCRTLQSILRAALALIGQQFSSAGLGAEPNVTSAPLHSTISPGPATLSLSSLSSTPSTTNPPSNFCATTDRHSHCERSHKRNSPCLCIPDPATATMAPSKWGTTCPRALCAFARCPRPPLCAL